jgi:putative transposase
MRLHGIQQTSNQTTTMNYSALREAFLQGEEQETAKIFRDMMRAAVRAGLFEAMAAEVEALCGPRYHPDCASPYQRAGSEKGVAYFDGGKEAIRRPRVRHESDGEVVLATYEASSNPRNLFDEIVAAVGQGLATRGAARALGGAVSKSEASRMWVEKSREQLEHFRSRSLVDVDWLCLMIDGIHLGGEICVVVAVGIDTEGNKRVLDFEAGRSESASVVSNLIGRLSKRGISEKEQRAMLILRDGSAAIASAVKKQWPQAIQQECLVHVQRNVHEQVRRRDRADCDLAFKRLRESQGKEAGEEAWEELIEFLSERNAAAALNLAARKEALLALHRLEVPATLNTTFLSTNLIENTIRNWREASGNVKRWNEKEDMVSRWIASGMLWAEAGYRKVRGHEDLGHLVRALEKRGATRPTPPQADVSLTTPASSVAPTKFNLQTTTK